jgi:hypothetical protein
MPLIAGITALRNGMGSLSKHTTTTIKHTAIPDQE